MSLYGSLFAGVSGLKSQGSKIGTISDNIANLNTVGYKGAQTQFETLVVTTSATASYAPGGALANTRYLVDKQGLVQSTDAPTDIAISGKGFFAVNAKIDGSGQPMYTRAGSFRQDNVGNFVNAAGFYLQGWPLDREGHLPGEPGNLNTISSANLDSLQTVNVASASGVASATTKVDVGANLDAGQTVYPGAGANMGIDSLSSANSSNTANTIIVSNDYGDAPTNSIRRGDAFTVTLGSGSTYTYTYGGFAIGREITAAAPGNTGDGGTNSQTTLGATPIATTLASTTVTVTDTAHNYGPVGATRTINISGVVAGDVAGTFGSASDLNGNRLITITGANTYTFQASSAALATSAGIGAAVIADDFTGNVLDASTATQAFLSTNTLAQFTTAARSFTINTATTGTVTFTYTASSPNAATGQFNNLTNLASAIDAVNGLTARVSGGRLYVGSEDANEAVTFANGDASGSGSLGGIDWIGELDLADLSLATPNANVTASSRRFSTLQGLNNIAAADTGVGTSVTNPLGDATLRIFNTDPLDTIQMQDYLQTPATALGNNPVSTAGGGPGLVTVTIALPGHTYQVGQSVTLAGLAAYSGLTAPELNSTYTITAVGAGTFDVSINAAGVVAAGAGGGGAGGTVQGGNRGSILAELGAVTSLNGAAYTQGNTGVLGPAYDASGATGDNMASGDITAQFSRNIRVYDALGTGHELRMSYVKTSTNTWAVEVHAIPASDVSTTLVDGQVATGNIVFNGDGTPYSVSTTLTNPITVNWTNGAVASTISFNWGTAGYPVGTAGATVLGKADGLTQFDSDYNVAFVNQNGAPVGELIGINIDNEGFVIASYNNGETQKLYKLPLADFTNPNGLKPVSGNVYTQTRESGEVNLREAGKNGTGTIVPSALEASNVDLSEQLTDMIVAQRAYQANTKVITASDQLLQDLNRMIG